MNWYEEKKHPCSICNTAGTMFAQSHDGQYRIFIRCSCKIWGGEVADPDLPQWKPAMGRDFTLVKIPSMRPDISKFIETAKREGLTDDQFQNDPRLFLAISAATANSQDWWRQQKLAAVHFWKDYFSEGMNR